MGVTGLWRLIEPAGKPVPIETLENKVLAVDISIWLHQMVKGYQDAKGAPLPNAHLMGLFQRLCKLLYFRIKPVFVFDGGFPDLKKETIAKRQDSKSKYHTESERLKRELALLLSKKTAISSLLGKNISPSKGTSSAGANNDDDLFKLPALPQKQESESESDDETESSSSSIDVHSIDIESDKFKTLAVKDKYDVLMELKETRKQNSWGKIHELPKKSDNFSDYQLRRLLKRRKVQECLEETEKEMGGCSMSLNELESLLNEEGIDTKVESLPSRRIASNNTTRFLLINNVKQALADAKKKKEEEEDKVVLKKDEGDDSQIDANLPKKDELEDDLEKAIKMSLECVNEGDTSVCTSKTDDSWTSCLTDTDYSHSDSEEDDGFEQPDMSSAKAYIMQYSDLTNRAITEFISTKNNSNKNKSQIPTVNKIIEELNNEKSVIVDNVDISSSDEDQKIIKETDNSISIKSVSSNQESSDEALQNKSEPNIDDTLLLNNSIDATQASIICMEKPLQVISLDTSTDELEKEVQNTQKTDLLLEEDIKKESCSNEDNDDDDDDDDDDGGDDFEEVEEETEKDTKSSKSVVQLTLNMDEVLDDDIFADIFTNQTKFEESGNNAITSTMKSENVNNTLQNVQPELKSDLKNVKPIIEKPSLNEEQVVNKNVEIKEANSTKPAATINNTVINSEDVTKDDTYSKEPSTSIGSSDIKDKNVDLVTDLAESIIRKPNNIPKEKISEEKLNNMIEDMQNKEQDLMQEKGKMDRIGRNITEQMAKEAQELLQIFGIPYIVAPMEAEAQCAFLESVNLTEGTITDDSDIWLFGGRTVYKNFFNQKKHVLQFLSERIERSFNLTREQLILLALLVGSDYTTGINGVGPVTALEILASFPFNKRKLLNESSKQNRYMQIVNGLQDFKQWVRAGKRTDNITLKKKLKNVKVTDDFPSVRVVQAYLEPNIEKSEEKITWGEMDITILRDYAKAKFGWSQNKLDEIIKPVIKRMAERKTQRSVQDYFKRKIEFQSLEDQMSKRVKAAVQRMDLENSIEQDASVQAEKAKGPKKRKINKKDEMNNQNTVVAIAGPSKDKKKKTGEATILMNQGVKVVSQIKDGTSTIEISIPKTDRCQEIIPQREKDKKSLLENKLKAIELFRKTKIDRKKKLVKRKALVPKKKADLSESDSD